MNQIIYDLYNPILIGQYMGEMLRDTVAQPHIFSFSHKRKHINNTGYDRLH
ncbi:hypothetical protein D3C78_600900 [compost metagenome]